MKNKIIINILYLILRLLSFSYRKIYIGTENRKMAKDKSPYKTYVYAVWHQNILSTLLTHTDEKYTMIISASKDGDIMAGAIEKFGHNTSRGSSSRDGKKALISVIKIMKLGFPASMAVDGPKGPIHVVKPGVLEMARLTESAVVPLSYYSKNFWCFNKSWDKFRLPKPFTTLVAVIGDPIFIDPNISREDFEELQKTIALKIHEGEVIAKNYLNMN